jgi:hypothetical protein
VTDDAHETVYPPIFGDLHEPLLIGGSDALVASGGICAPIPTMYDPWAPAWERPDHRFSGWPARWDVDRWVAPRLTRTWARCVRTWREAKLRLGVLVHGLPEPIDIWDDD